MAELLPRIAELSERLQKEPGSRLFVPLAEEYIKAGMMEEAAQVLVDGLKKHPEFFGARVALGRVYFEQRKFKEAKVELEQVLKASPDNLVALKKLSTIYRMEGERDKARRCCEMLLADNPKDAEARKLLDELTAADKSDAASMQIADPPFEIERGTRQSPPVPSVPEPPAAQAAQEPAEDDAPEELVSPTLAQLYLRQGHYAQAVRVYDQLLRREPQNETYQQAHSIALTLLQGQAGVSAGTEQPGPPSSDHLAGDHLAGDQPTAPAVADEGLAADLLSTDHPPMKKPPMKKPNDRMINKLQSWLLHIQQQRRRAS